MSNKNLKLYLYIDETLAFDMCG